MNLVNDRIASIDGPALTGQLSAFLRAQCERPPHRGGFVVGMSGGIDSALVGALAVEAVGNDKVFALMLPERESSADGRAVAREVIEALGIASAETDITPALETLNVYRQREELIRSKIPDFESPWTYRLNLPGDLRESAAMNVYRLEAFAPDGTMRSARLRPAELRLLQAATNVKQRVRMLELYRAAEARGWLVAGTTNRTELETGFFVRHGDGGVDVEPLAGLYKTQVYELARHLGLPRSVIDRPPSPDTWSAGVSDEEYFLRLPYAIVDRLLAGIDLNIAVLASTCGLSVDVATRARDELVRRRNLSARLRELPPCPEPWR